jgi:hypothetical protein
MDILPTTPSITETTKEIIKNTSPIKILNIFYSIVEFGGGGNQNWKRRYIKHYAKTKSVKKRYSILNIL